MKNRSCNQNVLSLVWSENHLEQYALAEDLGYVLELRNIFWSVCMKEGTEFAVSTNSSIGTSDRKITFDVNLGDGMDSV